MRALCIQIHPERLSGIELDAVVLRLEKLTRTKPFVERSSNGKNAYVNVTFDVTDPRRLWRSIRSKIEDSHDVLNPASNGFIVTCEGPAGWKDYLLLYHFDKREAAEGL